MPRPRRPDSRKPRLPVLGKRRSGGKPQLSLETTIRQLRAEKQTAEDLFRFDANRVMSKVDRDEALLCVKQTARWLPRLRTVLQRLDSRPGSYRSVLLPLVSEELCKRVELIVRLQAKDKAKAVTAKVMMEALRADPVLAAALLQTPRGRGRPPSMNEWFTSRAHDLLRRAGVTARERRNEILIQEGLKPAE